MIASRWKPSTVLISLLGPALLSACGVSQDKYDALQAQYQQLQAENAALTQKVASGTTQIGRLQGAIAYTVNSDLLFAPGSWRLGDAGKQVIAKIASQLAPTQQNNLVVNGYTDTSPIAPQLKKQGIKTNDELSQKRAEAVMEFLISQGVKPNMISAKGWGETHPIAGNDTPEGRAQNRRVEITVAGT